MQSAHWEQPLLDYDYASSEEVEPRKTILDNHASREEKQLKKKDYFWALAQDIEETRLSGEAHVGAMMFATLVGMVERVSTDAGLEELASAYGLAVLEAKRMLTLQEQYFSEMPEEEKAKAVEVISGKASDEAYPFEENEDEYLFYDEEVEAEAE